MNQISHITLGPDAPSTLAHQNEIAIHQALDAAWRYISKGALAAARSVTIRVVIAHQAQLVAARHLLEETLAALLASHTFVSAGRLVQAATGRQIRIVLIDDTADAGTRDPAGGPVTTVGVAPSCLTDTSAALLWSRQLLHLCFLSRTDLSLDDLFIPARQTGHEHFVRCLGFGN